MSSIENAEALVALSDEDLFALALDAVQYTLPLYEMARMRSGTSARLDSAGRLVGGSPESTQRYANQWVHTPKLLGPKDRRVVTPNNDTLYSSTWLDLSAGPVLFRVPAMASRYYVLGFLDMYTNPFGYIGSRTTGSAAGTFLVHGPDWSGDVPEGARTLACPTNSVWVLGRILVEGEQDVAAAAALQAQFTIEPVPGGGARVPHQFDAAMQASERLGDPTRFAAIVNAALAANAPPHEQAGLVAGFAACGIGAQCADRALTDAQQRALARALDQLTQTLSAAPPAALDGGWVLPVTVSESFGTDYRKRATVAIKYIGALGIEEAMYLVADRDADGALLDGDATYVIRFAPGHAPKTDAFWSLTAYESQTYMLAGNAIGRYSLGDRTRGLTFDADGGLRIAFSAHEPADPTLRANWLPTPAGRFYLALRLYCAHREHLDGEFRYPPIMRQHRPA